MLADLAILSHITMRTLKENPTLADIQEYVGVLERELGFDKTTTNLQSALQLGEEVGELFKAIRKAEKMRVAGDAKIGSIDEELADILIFISAIANRYSIDLEKALRNKEEINKKREWK
ncbi:MAG: hypothetical protein JWO73_317 [Candidatus Taylorbacteria bacterium]|nr:hypothetical protein [Candidatus Taylorbacteria bacterium]